MVTVTAQDRELHSCRAVAPFVPAVSVLDIRRQLHHVAYRCCWRQARRSSNRHRIHTLQHECNTLETTAIQVVVSATSTAIALQDTYVLAKKAQDARTDRISGYLNVQSPRPRHLPILSGAVRCLPHNTMQKTKLLAFFPSR